LDDLKEPKRYWRLKEEVQDRTLWRTRFGRGYGPIARQTTTWASTDDDHDGRNMWCTSGVKGNFKI
jgi:hypothetical protein